MSETMCDHERIIEWIESDEPRKPAHLAFTSGPERLLATFIEAEAKACEDQLAQERADHAAKVRELEAERDRYKRVADAFEFIMQRAEEYSEGVNDKGLSQTDAMIRVWELQKQRADVAESERDQYRNLLSDIAVFAPQFADKIRPVLMATDGTETRKDTA